MTRASGSLIASALALLSACTPTLDWREVRPEGDTLVAMFPCKPELRQRTVPIAGAELRMRQLGCEAGALHFSLAFVDADAPDRVEPLLAAFGDVLSGNLGAAVTAASAPTFAPTGATPHAGSRRVAVSGHRPDGSALRAESGLFVHGLRVYQATVLGSPLDDAVVSTFLQSLRFTTAPFPGQARPR